MGIAELYSRPSGSAVTDSSQSFSITHRRIADSPLLTPVPDIADSLNSTTTRLPSGFIFDSMCWRKSSDESLLRGAAELHDLVGDASKAQRELGWSPRVGFEDLVGLLVDAAVARLTAP